MKRFEDEDYPSGQPRRKGSSQKKGYSGTEQDVFQRDIQEISSNDIVVDLQGRAHLGLSPIRFAQSPAKFFDTAVIGNVPSRRRAAPTINQGQQKKCNCKNSKCLKLYCECFASGRYCDGCHCRDCHNNKDHEEVRQEAVVGVLERNPNAFRPKVAIDDDINDASTLGIKHHKGCNCKKSWCLKKYCECFQAGVFCTDSCRCVGCKNYEGSPYKTGPQVQAQDAAGMNVQSPLSLMRQSPQNTLGSPLQLSPEKKGFLGSSPEKRTPKKSLVHASLTDEQINTITSMCISEVIKPEVIKQVCTLLMLLVDENLEKLRQSNPVLEKLLDGDDNVLSDASQETIDSFWHEIQTKVTEQQETIDNEFLLTLQKIGTAIQEKVKEKKEMFQMHQNTFYNAFLSPSMPPVSSQASPNKIPPIASPLQERMQRSSVSHGMLQHEMLQHGSSLVVKDEEQKRP